MTIVPNRRRLPHHRTETALNILIWDFDGTLARRIGEWSGALKEVLALEGIDCHRDQLRPHLQSGFPWHSPKVRRSPGESADEWWDRLEPVFAQAFEHGTGVEYATARQLATRVRAVYLTSDRWELFDDSADMLELLKKSGWQHVLLSNHVPELNDILRSLGIASHFTRIFNSAETGIEKPNPEAYRNLLSAFPTARKIWMIGDSMNADVLGAEAEGIPAILVRSSHASATRSCRSLRELSEWLSSG